MHGAVIAVFLFVAAAACHASPTLVSHAVREWRREECRWHGQSIRRASPASGLARIGGAGGSVHRQKEGATASQTPLDTLVAAAATSLGKLGTSRIPLAALLEGCRCP